MPFVTASLPHSPQFTKALTDYDKTTSPWTVLRVHESRIAPTLVYVLCFFGLIVPSALELCPEGVINGILTFVGLQGALPDPPACKQYKPLLHNVLSCSTMFLSLL
jgi:hypothetical protein